MKHGLDDEASHRLLEKGRKNSNGTSEYFFLILFDGFDELPNSLNLFQENSLWEYNCKVIITTRREYLVSFEDYKRFF